MDKPDAIPAHGLRTLSAGDWIGAVVTLLGAVALVHEALWRLPAWEGMFRDFAAYDSLPKLTMVVLWKPFACLLAIGPHATLAIALLPPSRGLAWRRAWIVGGFVLGVAALWFVEWAVRLPLEQLAEAIR